jgi:FdhD protein
MSATTTELVRRWPDDEPTIDALIVEAPLWLRAEERPLGLLMRTPGHDRELAAGWLLGEGIIDDRADLAALELLPGDPDGATIVARFTAGVEAHWRAAECARERFSSSACGVCGRLTLAELPPPRPAPMALSPAWLSALPAALQAAQELFASTGGCHAAALVDPDGQIEVLREDVGRHNAVDKVLGWRLLDGRVPVDDRVLLVSSRAGYEVVQKAVVAGAGAVVAVGAASSLAVSLARQQNLALVGFLRADRHTRYV